MLHQNQSQNLQGFGTAAAFDDSTAVYRVNDTHSVIVADGYFTIANNNGEILDKISVSSFSKGSRTSFNKIKKLVE